MNLGDGLVEVYVGGGIWQTIRRQVSAPSVTPMTGPTLDHAAFSVGSFGFCTAKLAGCMATGVTEGRFLSLPSSKENVS